MNSITFLRRTLLAALFQLLMLNGSYGQTEFFGYAWEGGRITTVLDSTYFEYIGLSKNRNKRIYQHNEKGYPVSYISYVQDYQQVWIPEYKKIFEYDDKGNIIEIKEYKWTNWDNSWFLDHNYEYKYDDDNRVIWSAVGSTNSIGYQSYSEYEYNLNGDILSKKKYVQDKYDLYFVQKSFTYHYNDLGLLENKNSTFASDNGPVTATDYATYSYNDKHQLQQYIQYNKPTNGKPLERIQYNYNDQGMISNILQEDWRRDDVAWEFDCEYQFSYDEQGNVVGKQIRARNALLNDTITYTYDRYIKGSNIRILPEDMHSFGKPYWFGATHKFPVNLAMNTYHSSYANKIYYFSDFVVVNDVNLGERPSSSMLFPNPVKRFLNIQNEFPEPVNLTIYDLTGRKVFSKLVGQKASLDLEWLKKGVYVYHLETSESIKKGKIVKE